MKLHKAMKMQNDLGQQPRLVRRALRDHWEEHGPKLLEMVKEYKKEIYAEYSTTDEAVDALIAAAEEVEVS